jgi:hypothetical protein
MVLFLKIFMRGMRMLDYGLKWMKHEAQLWVVWIGCETSPDPRIYMRQFEEL